MHEVLPSLQATTRCCMHSAQRCMETALKSDNRCSQLLDEVVLKYSKPGDNKQPGSLARSLANSSKMAAKFKDYAADFASIDMLMGKAHEAPRFAAQRFDSIYSALEKLLLHLDGVIHMLLEVSATVCEQSQWAQELLRVAPRLQHESGL